MQGQVPPLTPPPSPEAPGRTDPPGPPASPEIDLLATSPTSLPDTEPWDNYSDPPALLDLLDRSDGSVASGHSELKLGEDTAGASAGGLVFQDQSRAEMLPADSNTEVSELACEAAHGTLHGGDETFWSLALENVFKHASVDSDPDRDHLELLRSRCSTDFNLQFDLEARVLHWVHSNSDLEIRGKCNGYLNPSAQTVSNGKLPGIPSKVQWLKLKDLPPRRPDVLHDVAFRRFLLLCAGGQQTGLMDAGLSSEDEERFSEWCQLVDDNGS